MQATDDMELLREYATNASEAAFETLVHRYVNLVYSVAFRQTHDSTLAGEVTQTVFIILAGKARKMHPETILAGWLYRTAQFAASRALRAEHRRQKYEEEAARMKPEAADATWEQMKPFLDEGMAQLGEKDRNAVLLRYFQDKSLKDVGAAFGTSERAAQKRVARAIEKLRAFFTKRGVVLPAVVVTSALSVNAVQAAPAGMASIAVGAALKGSATTASTASLIKATLKLMFWAKAQMAIIVSAGVALAAATTTLVVKDLTKEKPPSVEDAYLAAQFDSSYTGKVPQALFVHPTHFPLKNMLCVWTGGPLANAAGRNVDFAQLLTVAYHFQPSRMIPPPDVPTNHFDFLATLPNCPNEKFQEAIKTNSGWTAHEEMLETSVLLLKVKTAGAPGLRPATPLIGRWPSTNWNPPSKWGDGVYLSTNTAISDFRAFLEQDILKQPVIDQTGLSNKYDIDIQWKPLDHESLRKVLLDQLGLELVPSRERIEMLVVEQVKTGSKK